MKKKKKHDKHDHGQTIFSMQPLEDAKRRQPFDFTPDKNTKKPVINPTTRETWAIIAGALKASLLIAAVISVAIILFVIITLIIW